MDEQRHDFLEWFSGEHDRLVLSLALVLGELDGARRVASSTFVSASQRWSRIRRTRNPRVSLYDIALQHARRRSRRGARARLRRVRPTTWSSVVPREHLDVFVSVVALAHHQRLAVVLRHVAGFGDVETARWLDLPRRFYDSTLRIGTRRLVERLDDAAGGEPVEAGPAGEAGRAPGMEARLHGLAAVRLAPEESVRTLRHELRWRRDTRRTMIALTVLGAFVLTAPLLFIVHLGAVAIGFPG